MLRGVRLLLSILLIGAQFPCLLNAQPEYTVNEYFKVTEVFNKVSKNQDSIRVASVGSLEALDTVLLIQMKGWSTDVIYSNLFVGKYEILVIKQVIGDIIVFSTNLSYYTISGKRQSYRNYQSLQLVKMPSYSGNYRVNGKKLSCSPWNPSAETGGILAFIVKDTLILNNDIDVSGKGYRGGNNDVIQEFCVNNDPDRLYGDYPSTSDLAGWKGEGPDSLGDLHAKGRGYDPGDPYKDFATPGVGGGGGIGKNSGGGGGAGAAGSSAAGDGGLEDGTCAAPLFGGYGGLAIKSDFMRNDSTGHRVFMGSGGGGGIHSSSSFSSKGGNGGGIIIILAGAIKTNGFKILSNGEVAGAVTSGGAGGSGGGGSIFLAARSFVDVVNMEANGGDGRLVHVGQKNSAGGAGGGGRIQYLADAVGPTPVCNTKGGKAAVSGLEPAFDGVAENKLELQVSGWLNNFFPDPDDTICSGDIADTIFASKPSGGYWKPFKFKWYKKSVLDASYSRILVNADDYFYAPGVVDTTTFFKRVVESYRPSTNELISDSSELVYTIFVFPPVNNNFISYRDTTALQFVDTLCYGQTPQLLAGKKVQGGYGAINYRWEWDDSQSFSSINGTNTSQQNTSPALTSTTYFRRKAFAGKNYIPKVCSSISDTIKLVVLPLILNNRIISLTGDTMVCEGLRSPVKMKTPTGGDGSYIFRWESSGNGQAYSKVANTEQYTTNPLLPGQWNVRRIVLSGSDTVCKSISDTFRISIPQKLSGNVIGSNQTICTQTAPQRLTGPVPGGGVPGNTYIWHRRTDMGSWEAIDTSLNVFFDSEPLMDTAWFRRIVFSGQANTCKDTSNLVKITVQDDIGNNIVSHLNLRDSVLCYGDLMKNGLSAPVPTGGDRTTYLYTWLRSNPATDSITNTQNLTYSDRFYTNTEFVRITRSGACRDTSNIIFIRVLPALDNNLLVPNDSICIYTSPGKLNQSISLTGGRNNGDYVYSWQVSNGSAWTEVSQTESFRPVSVPGNSIYRRIVVSGPDICFDTASVSIAVRPRPKASLDFLNDFSSSICEYKDSVKLRFVADSGSAPFILFYHQGEVQKETIIQSKNHIWRDDPHPSIGVANQLYAFYPDSLLDKFGCKALQLTGYDTVRVNKKPEISMVPGDTSVCGKSIPLAGYKDVGAGIWRFAGGTPAWVLIDSLAANTTLQSANNQQTALDTTTVIWFVDNAGCTHSVNAKVNLYRILDDKILAPPHHPEENVDTVIFAIEDFSYPIRAEVFDPLVEVGNWSFFDLSRNSDGKGSIVDPEDSVTFFHQPRSVGDYGEYVYQLIWTVNNTENICPASTDTATIAFAAYHVYDGFSPDGNPLNQYLICEGLAGDRPYEFIVFDKWGKKVFEHKGVADEMFFNAVILWKGTIGEDLNSGKYVSDGMYFYTLKVDGFYYKKYNNGGWNSILIKRSR